MSAGLAIEHQPVLVAEALALLAPGRGGLYVDATVGLGGHAEALLAQAPDARLLGLDRDPRALERAALRLAPFGARVRLENARFEELPGVLARLRIGPGPALAGVLADLGVSSLQLESAERGFSFRRDGPLDMRMGSSGVTAAELLNQSAEGELETIFREFGEEKQARRIARAIVEARAGQPLASTGELKRLIDTVKGERRPGWRRGGARGARGAKGAKGAGWAGREARIDPATQVFQALRIAVNQELAGLDRFIEQAVRLLETDGRLVIISYHSLEDRIVKNTLRDLARGEVDQVTGRPRSESQLIETLTRKPLRPQPAEVAWNPRSRSARLRAARRL